MSKDKKNHINFEGIERTKLNEFFQKNIKLKEKKNKRVEYKILYVGTCFQTSILLPFIEQLIAKCKLDNPNFKIEVVTVVNQSSFSVFKHEENSLFENNVVTDEMMKQPSIVTLTPSSQEKIQVDLSKEYISDSLKEQKKLSFDYIFCLFENHFEINWRIGLVNLLGYLKNGGDYFFAEINGDFEQLDGNFKRIKEKKLVQWQEFDQKRSEFHYWKPELSVTNYKAMRNQIGRVFKRIIEKTGKGKKPWKKGFFKAADEITLSEGNLKNIVRDGKLAYFRIGLPLSDTKKTGLIELINGSGNFFIDLQVYWAKNFKSKWLKALKPLEWNFSALLKDLQQINDNNLSSLGRKALDVLASHDIIFPQHTRYLALIEWTDPRSNEWEYPVHFLINESLYQEDDTDKKALDEALEKDINAWFEREKEQNISLAKTIFQNSTRKNVVRFICLKELDQVQYKESKKLCLTKLKAISAIFKLLEEVKFSYKIETDRKGNVKELNVFFETTWNKPEIPNNLNQSDENQKNNEPDKNALVLNEKREIFKGLSRWQLSRPSNTDANNDHAQDDDSNNEPFEIKENDKKFEKKLEDLLNLAILTHFYKSTRVNHELTFYPSAIIEKKGGADAVKIEGLGGIILYEKYIDKKEKKILKTLYEARNRALIDATNLIFYKASIVSHVDQDFKRHARKAAIAAINARNSSHVIGSHVFPGVINNNQFATEHHQTFFQYLMRRGEYIAQLTSEFPSWSVPTWFGRELMAEFYRQYCLLDSIASAEGVRSYHYSGDDNQTQNKLHLKVKRRCWYKVEEDGQLNEQAYFLSRYLSSKDTIDLATNNDLEQFKKQTKFYGIIVAKDGEYWFLYFEKENVENKTLDKRTYAVLKLNFSISPSENLRDVLKTGSRAIVSACVTTSEDNKLVLNDASVIEISCDQYVINSDNLEQNQVEALYENELKDIQINIPGGSTGYHAFYIILENIIRNAAKHDWATLPPSEKSGKNLEISIELEEKEEFHICKIWTNAHEKKEGILSLLNKTDLSHRDARQFKLRGELNAYLIKDIISIKEEQETKSHLGVSEIKLNAAFLANKSLDVEENISGENVLLNNHGQNGQEGYIKASGIWDMEEDQGLVLRLGYRFKLLKAKEVLIVCDKPKSLSQIDESKLRQHHIKILSHQDAFKQAKRAQGDKIPRAITSDLNYEFCLIVNDEDAFKSGDDPTQWSIVKLIKEFINNPEDSRLLFPIICDLIESYPYRLFFTEVPDEGNDNLFQILKEKDTDQSKFIRSRIFFLPYKETQRVLVKNLDEFKKTLYEKWLLIYRYSSDKYVLKIGDDRAGNSAFVNDTSDPPTLPPQLKTGSRQFEGYYSTEHPEDKNHIEYRRHLKTYKNRNKTHRKEYYLDDLSGKSRSFYLFSMFANAGPNSYLRQKLKYLFIENALGVVMVIDKTIFDYGKKDGKVFSTKNIIIPSKISKEGKTLKEGGYEYSRSLSKEEECTVHKDPIEIKLKNQKKEETVIQFYQPNLTQIDKEPYYSINTLIINQSILEILAAGDSKAVEFFIVQLKTKCYIPNLIITIDEKKETHSKYRYAKYVPFSIIESSLKNNNPDKLSLMTALFKTLN